MRPYALLCSMILGGCSGLLGDTPDVDYVNVIVPVVTECGKPNQDAISVMEVGFAKVKAACETFFVDATRFQQNALAANNTMDAGLIGATAIITNTSSAAAAVKALAVTTAGVTFGKAIANQYVTIYSFGPHLQKVRQLATADMDLFTNAARTQPPTNACRAYSLVQELALKCTLAALKDIESQQMNIPSGPAVPATLVVGVDANRRMTRSLVPRSAPSVGVRVVPY